MVYLAVALIGGIVCAFVAVAKSRNPLGWFAIGALLPLVGFILLLVLPAEQPPGSAPSPQPPVDPSSDLDELAKLADLRDRNVLTADEFEGRKRKILEREHGAPASRKTAPAPTPALNAAFVDDAQAKTLLVAAQEHQFSKRWEDAKREYEALISRFPDTKQATVARQQLINLKGT